MTVRMVFNVLLLAGLIGVTGCSMILDPTYCESDEECQGGTCTNGVCVSETMMESDRGVSADVTEPEQDATVTADMAVVSDAGSVDSSIEADMQVDARVLVAPECELSVDETVTNQADIQVSVTVTDADDTSETLTATLNGDEITLNRMLEYRGFFTLAEGANTIDLVVTDRDGQTCEQSISVMSDRTAPQLELIDPTDGDDILTNQNEITVRGRVTDPNFTDDLTILVNDRGFQPEPPVEWADGQFLFRVPLEPESYDIEIFATDDVGNESDPVAFRIESDIEPPVLSLLTPPEGELVISSQRRYMVRGTVEDGGRVVRNPRVTITVSQGDESREYAMPAAGVDGSFSQFVELFNGENQIRACGLDDAGNQHCAEGQVRKNQPCVNLDSPLDGAFVGSLSIDLSGTVCAGVDTIEASINDGPLNPGLIEGDRFTVNLRAPQAGAHQVRVRASNSDGESAEVSINITVDPSAPTLQVQSPENGVCVSGSVEVTGQAQDDRSGIQQIRINATEVEQIELGGSFRQEVPVLDGADFELRVVAVNGAGVETERVRTVRGDSVAPEVRFDILNPLLPNNPWLAPNGTGRIRIAGRVDTGICGLAQGGLTVDNLPVNLDNGRFEFERVYPHGQQSVLWVATDLAGNVREGNFVFRVDELAPVIVVTSPGEGVFTADDQVVVTARIEEVGVGLRDVRVNGQNVVPFQDADGFLIEAVIENLVEGQNTIDIEATDEVGNRSEVSITINRDVTPVQIDLTEPQANQAVPLPFTVTGTAGDGADGSGVQSITVNGVNAEYNAFEGTWVAHGVMVSPDEPTLRVTALDRVGNELVTPLERPLQVGVYGVQSRTIDGLGTAQDSGLIEIADLNRDGLPDVVALSNQADGISANYIQGGIGDFSARGPGVSGIAADYAYDDAIMGDVDGDGSLDLIATADGGSFFLKGMGNGAFLAGEVNLPSMQGPTRASLLDVNRDNRLDLLLLGADGAHIYFGDRDGILAPESIDDFGLASLTDFASISALDVNDDGVTDLVSVGPDGAQLWVGDRDDFVFDVDAGSGLSRGAEAPDGIRSEWLDANQDGMLDVFIYGGNAEPSLYLGEADGQFTNTPHDIVWRETDTTATVADIDGDSRDDIVVGGADGVQVWLSTEAGFVASAAHMPFDGSVLAIAARDMDLDGDVDLILGNETGIHYVRSNRAQLEPEQAYILLDVVRHELPPRNGNGAIDGHGVIVYVQYVTDEQLADPQLGGQAFEPNKAILVDEVTSMLLHLGDFAGVRLKVHYVDIGGRGSNTRSFLNGVPAGQQITSFARE